MIPQIENSIINETIDIITYPNKTYKYSELQIAGKVDSLEAIRQSINHILSIERYSYLIYDDDYGVELNKYIGQDLSYLESTIEETLKEALTQDDRILDVQVTDISEELVEQENINLSNLLKKISTQNKDPIIKENNGYILTNNSTIPAKLSQGKAKIVNVKFNVFCKEGVINTEVNINV